LCNSYTTKLPKEAQSYSKTSHYRKYSPIYSTPKKELATIYLNPSFYARFFYFCIHSAQLQRMET